LFQAEGVEKHISGVILYDETFHQKSDSGERLVDLLTKRGILPGIKVDTGVTPLAGTLNETTTQGR